MNYVVGCLLCPLGKIFGAFDCWWKYFYMVILLMDRVHHVGIRLKRESNSLVSAWNSKAGQISAKYAYESIYTFLNATVSYWWHSKLWKSNYPLNIKWFSQLCMEKMILTYDNLIKKSFLWPNACFLCKSNEESIQHLFVEGDIFEKVWFEILFKVHVSFKWYSSLLEYILLYWFIFSSV